MFKAIGRYFRAIGYFITGRFDEARRTMSTNPSVVRATFDRIISEKKASIQQYKNAVGAMIAQEEKKKDDLRQQTNDVTRLTKLRDGAAAMARKVVERHAGDTEAVKQDPEYQKCQSAYSDFSSTLTEKEERCQALEEDIQVLQESIGQHKVQLESLMREVEQVSREKHETVADLITAKEEQEVSDMISGISRDRTSEELQEMRDLRREAKATARVSRELAGVDTQKSEQEFLEYAEKSAASDEFDALIGLSREAEGGDQAGGEAAEGEEKTRIPEN